jgi:deoxyribonuclease V
VDAAQAVLIQKDLASRVRVRAPWKSLPRRMRVAATDVGCPRGSRTVTAAAVLVELPGCTPLEVARVRREARFPYVPGLLSFREAPVVLEALARLGACPDAVICDGQGLAHPRRMGLACHVGLSVDLPTVGCAKSRLCGTHEEVGPRRGDVAPLVLEGVEVGRVLRSREGTAPLFVSPGHRIDIARAVDLVMACLGRYRLPDPCRMAHQAAGWRGKEATLLAHLAARAPRQPSARAVRSGGGTWGMGEREA